MSKDEVKFPIKHSEVTYKIANFMISNLEGQLLTQIDASISDPVNRQALKDIIRRMVWEWAFSCSEIGSETSINTPIEDLKI